MIVGLKSAFDTLNCSPLPVCKCLAADTPVAAASHVSVAASPLKSLHQEGIPALNSKTAISPQYGWNIT